MRSESNGALISALLMVLMMVMASAMVPFTAYDDEQVLAGPEAAASGRVTGNETVSASNVAGWYASGSTVWANISASNLDPNTNYTLVCGSAHWAYNSVIVYG